MKKIFYYNITYRCNQDCIFCAADHGRNDSNKEIPLHDFIRDLKKNNISSGDRVIVNGGEPTVHKNFLEFLSAIHDRGAYIDLFTNGQKLSDYIFCKKVCSCNPILIRIPLFGAESSYHDYLTGTKGGFDNVIQAIRNILSIRSESVDSNIDLEIKLLMSKATNDENLSIFRKITKIFPNHDYYFSLNPLLISERVRNFHKIMFSTYTTSIKKAKSLLDEAKEKQWEISTNLIPLCLLDKKDIQLTLQHEVSDLLEYYTDPQSSFEFHGEKHSNLCDQCILSKYCAHFPESYSNFYGNSEVRPFSIDDIKCYQD